MWEVFMNGKEPYEGMSNMTVQRVVLRGFRMDAPKGMSSQIAELMHRCWRHASQRPNFSVIETELHMIANAKL